MSFSETELILKMKNDSREAFFILYQKYQPVVENFALSLLKDSDTAKEITQNLFIKIWDRRRALDTVSSFKSYLFKMTRNAVFDYMKRYSRNVSFDEMAGRISVGDFAFESEPDIDARNLLMKLLVILDELPENRRKIFLMSRMLGMKNGEIAESIGLSVKTVEYHISKALIFLRKNIKL